MRATTNKAAFVRDFVDLEAATNVEGAVIDPHQIQFLNNTSRLGIDCKSRQATWSFTAALDASSDGVVHPGTPHIFVSINLEEAKEKILYSKSIIAAMHPDVRPRLVGDSVTGIAYENGSRIISHPCRPARGKALTRFYLDEYAHYKVGLDREILTSALPAISRGGYIRIGSSPCGASGMFWELFTQSLRKWPGYVRRSIPWWCVFSLCKDTPTAVKVAPSMTTNERVHKFAIPSIVEIFENMFLEDFQQEYECEWVDEASAWIDWEIIKRNQDDGLLAT